MKKIFTSIDIGSDTVKILVSELVGSKIKVIAATSFKSKGIRKGLVIDSNLAINTIKDGMKIINDDLGFEAKKVVVNVPSYNAKFMYVTSEVDIEESITTENINKVIKTSVYNKIEEEYELVTVIPVEFIVDKPNGMQHFEALEATNANPIYTKVWGNIISRTIITTETEEGAFGEPLIREVQRKSKKWVIASTSKYPYDFGDEKILTMEEVQKAIQNREIYLAEVKKRAEDYKTQKQANALSAPTANVAAHVTTGEFQF